MKIKLVHVCASGLSVKYLLYDQLKYLETLGYEVHAISSGDILGLEDLDIKWHKVNISRKVSPIQDIIAIVKLVKLFRDEKFTIVHTHTPKGVLLGQIAAKIANIPIILQTLHGFYFTVIDNSLWRMIFRRLEIFNCRNCDFILSQNPEDIDRIKKENICNLESVQLLGNGIDVRRFSSYKLSEMEKANGRKAIGISSNAVVLGIVGRFVEGKGYKELMDASLALRKKYPDLHVLAIGSSSTVERSLEVIDPLDSECVDFWTCLFDRSDMPYLYSLMDIFVLPSYREAFPRSAMEAAAVSLPIVTTNVRGCRQVVIDGFNGFLVTPRDSESLIHGLEKLLQDQGLADKMGRNGYEMALANFDQGIVFQRVANTYERFLGRLGFI